MSQLDGLSPAEKRELLARLLKQKNSQQLAEQVAGHAAGQVAGQVSGPVEFPMSAGQQGLWYAFRRDPLMTAYNVFMPSRYKSPVDLQAIRLASESLVRRHRSLRTVFAETEADHSPVQRVVDELPPEFRIVDAAGWSDARLHQEVLDETQRPFDLTKGPLLRVAAFQVAADDVVLVSTTHHIAVDFWSLVLIMDEVRKLYPAFAAGQSPSLHEAPQNYDRFVQSQLDLVKSPAGRSHAEYWSNQLADVQPVLQWSADYHRPARFTHRAAVQSIPFAEGTAQKIAQLARRSNVTANVIVMALLQVLIARQSGQKSFAIGSPFSGRSGREYEQTVGFFVNMLPVIADLSDSPTLNTLIRRVGTTMVDALQHESLPFSEIVKDNAPGRDPSRNPLFQVSCTFEQAQVASEKGRAGFLLGDDQAFDDFAGLRQESFFVQHPTCHYDVEFVFELLDDSIRGMICYCRDLFAAETIDVMARHFTQLVDALLADPHSQVLDAAWCQPDVAPKLSHTTSTISELLNDSQDDIVARAKRVAFRLQRGQVRPGEVVPVCMERGADAWVAILGVMFAGGTAVPLDASQPSVGVMDLAEDAEVRFAIVEEHDSWCDLNSIERLTLSQLEEASPGEEASPSEEANAFEGANGGVPDVLPDSLAYVVYTSGSTGQPKGVMIQHHAISNTLQWRRKTGLLCPEDRVLVLVSHQFDASMVVVPSTIHQKATAIWPDDPSALDIDQLIEQIIRDRITVLPAVPSLLRALVSHPRFGECRSLRQIWSGGEAMSVELVKQIHRSAQGDIVLWNFYGPTEAAVEATAIQVTDADPRQTIAIGHSIDGVEVYVLDERLRPVPDGVSGQLAIGGKGLAMGYLNRPELTNQCFIESETLTRSDGAPVRLYLTGDRGRRRGDGTYEFLGRLDHQIKLRGYRIELEEIERMIEQSEQVSRAAVKVIGAGTEAESLAAYVETEPSFRLDRLRKFLAERLPPFKRPHSITPVDRLPTGTSGKVLRDQLPEPVSDPLNTEDIVEPRSDFERFLIDRFCETLGLSTVSVDSNFFESGGTSLQAAMLTSQLSGELGFNVPTSLLFDLGDVGSVSARLAELHQDQIVARFGLDSISVALEHTLERQSHELLAVLKPTGDQPPVFMIHPPGGIVVCYREIADAMPADQPLVAVRSRGIHGDEALPQSLQEMASEYADAIQSYQPDGPYTIGGWSLGGVIAYEVACQLRERQAEVGQLILLDSTVPEKNDDGPSRAGQEYGIDLSLSQLSDLSDSQQLPMLYDHAQRLGVLDKDTPAEVIENVIEDLRRLFAHHVQLCESYSLESLPVPVLLLRPSDVPVEADPRPDRGWGRWVQSVRVETVSGHHHSMVKQPGASEVAKLCDYISISGRETPQAFR